MIPPPAFDCRACGACCTARVELEPGDAEIVPLEFVDPRTAIMRTGIGRRCIALSGTIGSCVECRIYERRPAICRKVKVGDPMCLFARNMHGMAGGKCVDVVLTDVLAAIHRRWHL